MLLYVCRLLVFINVANSLQLENNVARQGGVIQRVVNGKPASLGDVPYQLAMKVRTWRDYYATFCGAILISDKKIISAAHCFEEKGSKCFKGEVTQSKLSTIRVVAGNLNNVEKYNRHDSLDNGQWRTLESMIYPKRYRFPNNDISVGNAKKPFLLNANVKPIPWTKKFHEYHGTCLVSGFGRINDYQQSSKLLVADLVIVPTSRCSRLHRRNMIKFVCTDMVMTDVGSGDSGGPLVCTGTGDPAEDPSKGILVGVVSGTRLTVGSFFTRVSSYRKFIQSSAQTHRGCILLLIINAGLMLFLFQ